MVRWHKGSDGWGRDSYRIPDYAVAGSSHTGAYSYSPAPTSDVKKELGDLKKYLKSKGISSRIRATRSGNMFMQKVWVVVSRNDYKKARKLALDYLKKHESDTYLIHDAD